MKPKYEYLTDEEGNTVVTVCKLKDCFSGTAYGMAIKSITDEQDEEIGRRIAFARAERALKNRQPCYISREEVYTNLWHLSYPGWMRFMELTDGNINSHPKGWYELDGIYDSEFYGETKKDAWFAHNNYLDSLIEL